MLYWTLRYVYLFKLQLFLDVCPGVVLQDHMATPLLVFWGISILFSIVAVPIYIPTNTVGDSVFSTYFSAFVICRFSVVAPLTSVRWYLTVVLICVSLIISVVTHLFTCCCSSVCLFLEKCVFRSSARFLVIFLCSCYYWVVLAVV